MRQEYTKPWFEVIRFDAADVICASGNEGNEPAEEVLETMGMEIQSVTFGEINILD